MFAETFIDLVNFINVISAGSLAASAVDPLYDAITMLGPYAISVVALLGLIYGIIVGVKFARAEKAEERQALQKALVSGVIGAISIVILLSILYAIREPLVIWMNNG